MLYFFEFMFYSKLEMIQQLLQLLFSVYCHIANSNVGLSQYHFRFWKPVMGHLSVLFDILLTK